MTLEEIENPVGERSQKSFEQEIGELKSEVKRLKRENEELIEVKQSYYEELNKCIQAESEIKRLREESDTWHHKYVSLGEKVESQGIENFELKQRIKELVEGIEKHKNYPFWDLSTYIDANEELYKLISKPSPSDKSWWVGVFLF